MNYLVNFVADMAVLALTKDGPVPRGLPVERVKQATRAVAAAANGRTGAPAA
jgi:hypothetical protein